MNKYSNLVSEIHPQPSLLLVAVLANEFFPKFTAKIITVTPLIGVILTTLLCASPVSFKNIMQS